MAAAQDVFERLGWSGATMRAVADQASVSVKTVEALYRTKAELLKAAVDYAIAGDVEPIPMLARESVAAMEAGRGGGAGTAGRGAAARRADIQWRRANGCGSLGA
jgi:AcrR family transcriptional regulator